MSRSGCRGSLSRHRRLSYTCRRAITRRRRPSSTTATTDRAGTGLITTILTGDHRHHPRGHRIGRRPGRIHSRLDRSLADRVCFARLASGVSAVRVHILLRHVTTVVVVMFRFVVRLRFRLRLTGRCRLLLLLIFGWRACRRLRGVCVAWLQRRLTFAEVIGL